MRNGALFFNSRLKTKGGEVCVEKQTTSRKSVMIIKWQSRNITMHKFITPRVGSDDSDLESL